MIWTNILLQDLLTLHGLNNHVDFPTHITGSSLDPVISDFLERTVSCCSKGAVGSLDHYAIFSMKATHKSHLVLEQGLLDRFLQCPTKHCVGLHSHRYNTQAIRQKLHNISHKVKVDEPCFRHTSRLAAVKKQICLGFGTCRLAAVKTKLCLGFGICRRSRGKRQSLESF